MIVHDVINLHNFIYTNNILDLNNLSVVQEIELRIECCIKCTDDGYGDKRSLENYLNSINTKQVCDLIVINVHLDEMESIVNDVELLKAVIKGYKYLATCNT